MTSSAKRLLDAAMKLPEDERLRVTEELVAALDDSSDENVDETWAKEVERRSHQIASGNVTGLPWSTVKKAAALRARGKA